MKIKMLPAYLLRRELLVPMCALLATGYRADAALATGVSSTWKAFALSGGKDSLIMTGTSKIDGNAAVVGANYSDKDDDDDDDNSHNIGTGALRTFNLSGNARVTGKLYYDTAASGSVTGGASVYNNAPGGYLYGGTLQTQLNAQALAAKNQANTYMMMSNAGFTTFPTKIKQSTNLTLSGTLTGTATPNVLNLSELSLSGSAMLTLAGTSTSQFVINVTDKFSLSGTSKIVLSGGVDPLNVIFNYKGKEATMSGSTSLNGVLMAVNGTAILSGSSMVRGQVIAGKINMSGSAMITSP